MFVRIKESKLRKYKNKASALIDKGKYRKALAIYREILAAFPDDTQIMLKVGDLCRKLGMNNEAVTVYRNALGYHASAGRLMQAIAVCKLILEVDPTHREAQERLAALYTEKYGAPISATSKDAKAHVASKSVLAATTEESVPQGDPRGTAEPEHEPEPGREPEPEMITVDFSSLLESDESSAATAGDEPIFELDDLEWDGEPGDVKLNDEDVITVEEGRSSVKLTVPPPPPQTLPHIPLFSDLDQESFAELVRVLPVKHFEAVDTIVEEGEMGASFYVIVSGTVEVFKNDQSVAILEEGAFFGEMALLVPGPRQATVVCVEPTTVLEVSNLQLEQLKVQYPNVAGILLNFAEERLLTNLMLTSRLFEPFSEDDRLDLMQRFEPVMFKEGEVVMEAGQIADGMYLVVSGAIRLTLPTVDGEVEQEIAVLRANDVVGEWSLLTRQPSSFRALALSTCRALRLPAGRFTELMMTHPQILEMVADMADERSSVMACLGDRKAAASGHDGTALL